MLAYIKQNRKNLSAIIVQEGLLYEKDLVISLRTISDDKSHKALAIMVSITEMSKFIELTNVDKLFLYQIVQHVSAETKN